MDVGCGVASFGGYLLQKGVLTMSFAPKDEHEAQIQFALERGIPAILSVIGTQKLTFPDNVYDVVHCARCRVHWDADGRFHTYILCNFYIFLFPWKKKKPCYASCFAHCIICSKGSVMVLIYSWKNFFSFNVSLFQIVGGMPLLELNRILRPGGYFIWSATPVYRDNSRDRSVWNGLKPVFLCFYNSNARNVIISSVISFLY